MYAVNYAKERIQGANLTKPNDGGVPIIQHPDVRRQLLTMKSYVEAMRSLVYYVYYCSDMIATTDDEATKDKFAGLIEILTPIAKGYVTDRSFEVCSHAMQVYGGYGFIEEYPVAQLMRDCRITMIYEGTNGIQAMDLLGRKLGMKKGKVMMDLFGEMQATVAKAKKDEAIAPYAKIVENALNNLGEVAMKLGKTAMSDKVMNAFSVAHPFMDVTGDMVMAWMLLWRATIASQKLEKAKKKDIPFYKGQISNMEFFAYNILPITIGKMEVVKSANGAAVEAAEESFAS